MRSVEGKEEVYPSRIWEANLELVSLHSGENLASAPIRPGKPATPKTMGGDQAERPTPERRVPESTAPLLLKKTVVRLLATSSGSTVRLLAALTPPWKSALKRSAKTRRQSVRQASDSKTMGGDQAERPTPERWVPESNRASPSQEDGGTSSVRVVG
jgi:hypothetical protein